MLRRSIDQARGRNPIEDSFSSPSCSRSSFLIARNIPRTSPLSRFLTDLALPSSVLGPVLRVHGCQRRIAWDCLSPHSGGQPLDIERSSRRYIQTSSRRSQTLRRGRRPPAQILLLHEPRTGRSSPLVQREPVAAYRGVSSRLRLLVRGLGWVGGPNRLETRMNPRPLAEGVGFEPTVR